MTQLSNPRTAKGSPLRCPECGRLDHPADTRCKLELAAREASQSTRPPGAPGASGKRIANARQLGPTRSGNLTLAGC